MRNYFLTLFVTLFYYFAFHTLHAQGTLPIKNFSYKEYQGNATVWSLLQDKAGFLYAGSTGSLMQYDGSQWRHAKTDAKTVFPIVRDFYEDKAGRVYAFGDGTIGYFTTNSKSELVFKSLIDKLPEKAKGFTIGTKIIEKPDGIYFSAVEWLARWNGKEFTVWYAPKSSFTRGFNSQDKIYVRENNTGFYVFENEKFSYIKGSAIFADEREEKQIDDILVLGIKIKPY
jgi:hypothetical protein